MVLCNNCGNEIISDDLNQNERNEVLSSENLITSKEIIDSRIEKETGKMSKRIIIIISACVLLFILGIGCWYYYDNIQTQKILETKEKYESDLSGVVWDIIVGTSRAEDMINVYSDIWQATIKADYGLFIKADKDEKVSYTLRKSSYESFSKKGYASDFNYALEIVYGIFNDQGKIDSISTNKSSIKSKVQLLNNPAEEYKTAYEIAFALYGYYEEYSSLAQSPSGSLSSFNQKAGELSDKIVKKYKEFQVRMPSK